MNPNTQNQEFFPSPIFISCYISNNQNTKNAETTGRYDT